MIHQPKALKLIKSYEHVCEKYEQDLKYVCERFTNNHQPDFTDQEEIGIDLFSVYEEQKFKVKQMYYFTKDYLQSCFPKLGSYVAFFSLSLAVKTFMKSGYRSYR